MLWIYDFGTFTIYCVCITVMSRLTISSSTLIKFCIWFLVWLLKFTHEYRKKLRIIGWGVTNHELQFIDQLSLRWNLFWCNKMTLSLFWTNVSVRSTSLIVQSLPAWFCWRDGFSETGRTTISITIPCPAVAELEELVVVVYFLSFFCLVLLSAILS